MATYRTPGVYVEENATLPPSVAEVSTAIPAFIGYTEKVPDGSTNVPVRIDTLLEFELLFGRAQNKAYKFTVNRDAATGALNITDESNAAASRFNMHYALRLFYSNGGGSCYIVSLGAYPNADTSKAKYLLGLDAIDRVDEPTLLVIPDAVTLTANDSYGLCGEMLRRCATLKDRFAILDVRLADDGKSYQEDSFRTGIGNDYLNYGAAYLPYLNTGLAYQSDDNSVSVRYTGGAPATSQFNKSLGGANGLTVKYTGAAGDAPQVEVLAPDGTATDFVFAVSNDKKLSITLKSAATGNKATNLVDAWQTWKANNAVGGFDLAKAGTASETIAAAAAQALDAAAATGGTYANLSTYASTQTDVYNAVKAFLNNQPTVVLPPSAAIAGVYARVDRERGVWKAPANVGLNNVIGPTRNVTNTEQDGLNSDPTSGKSINVIRSFAGKGTLVWGARTLAGNDNEWRFIPVRRLFIMIEESIQKATAFAVFEANDTSTWLKVKAMIESYLFGLWQQGALAGPTPKAAYFVNVGLGKTMTDQDILNGRMIVEVGVAAVRPAEFIILRFSHKLQEA